MYAWYAYQTNFELRPLSVKKSILLKLGYKPCPLSEKRHRSFSPTVSLRGYHKTVISDILDKEDNVGLLNFRKIITSL